MTKLCFCYIILIRPYWSTKGGKKLISSAARYGVKAMLDIVNNADEARVRTCEISERQRIPRAFLTKIIERLVHAGLLTSQRGANGGLALAKPVHEIPLLEIVEAINGHIRRNPCFIRPDKCVCNRECPIYEAWDVMQNNFAELLANHTLGSMVCGKKPVHEQATDGSVYV